MIKLASSPEKLHRGEVGTLVLAGPDNSIVSYH